MQAADGGQPQAQAPPQQQQQEQRRGLPPQQEQQQQPSLAGDNAMNVVLVGAECAPWSKTGARLLLGHLD